MRLIIQIIAIFFLFLTNSCHDWQQYNDKSLEILKRYVSEDYYDHFPKLTESNDQRLYFFEPSTKGLSRSYSAFLVITNDSNCGNIINKLEETAIANYAPDDRCLLVVNLFRLQVSDKIFLEHYQRTCEGNHYPIPNFLISLSAGYPGIFTQQGQLTDDFSIFVLESDSVNIIDNNSLGDAIGLPNSWKHGFSKGVAVSQKRQFCIYWIDAW